MLEKSFDISIVIPAKDEALRLPQFLKTLIDYCLKSHLRYEIIIVDDGSTDKTVDSALNFQQAFPSLTVLKLERNHGKGYAVQQGILASHGEIALFMDADGSTGPDEIEKNLKYFQEGYDIVIGSRVIHNNASEVKAKFYRKFMGWIFNFLVTTFLIKNIKDTQCGFKMFRRGIIPSLWKNIHLEGFGFDLEILFLAQQMNYKIKEEAVNWKHVENSKVNLIKDSWRMLINIFQIRSWYRNKKG